MSVNPEVQAADARPTVDITALLYDTAFNRAPEDGGLNAWVDYQLDGHTSLEVADALVNSQEFAADHAGQDLAGIVNSFYENVLGREADDAGLQYWTGSGLSVAQILDSIAHSQEALDHNAAALNGYEALVSAGTTGAANYGADLSFFAPPVITTTDHDPLDPQFLNAAGKLTVGDGTTQADGFATISAKGGLTLGVEVTPTQTSDAFGGGTYTPVSATLDGTEQHVTYEVPSGSESIANGSSQNSAFSSAVTSHFVVGLDQTSPFDFKTYLEAGNKIDLVFDTDNSAAQNLVTFHAYYDERFDTIGYKSDGGFLIADFHGTDHVDAQSMQQSWFTPHGVADLTQGAQFDNYLIAYGADGQVQQSLHETLLLGPAGVQPHHDFVI